ncbi:MAG: alpha/beta hydrolase [Oleiphilaceae bacterium]|nr:alpha/beta hydrolase [Oleiphilaceae bacterium]
MGFTLDSGVVLENWTHTTRAGHRVSGYLSPPSGKPVLHFIHGNGYCGLVYQPLLSRLSEHYDLFISDIQGHGNSETGDGFVGWNETAELCREVWLHFRPRWGAVPVIGAGHSFGAIMTSLMLHRQPDLFDRAILLDPVLFSPNMLRVMWLATRLGLWHRNAMATRTRRKRRQWPDRDSAREAFRERGMFRGWDKRALEAYVTHGLKAQRDAVTLKCPPELEAQIFSTFPRRLWRSIKAVTTPIHVLYGDSSYPFVRTCVPRWASLNPAVTAESLPGGHCFMQQDPDRAAEVILARLKSNA